MATVYLSNNIIRSIIRRINETVEKEANIWLDKIKATNIGDAAYEHVVGTKREQAVIEQSGDFKWAVAHSTVVLAMRIRSPDTGTLKEMRVEVPMSKSRLSPVTFDTYSGIKLSLDPAMPGADVVYAHAEKYLEVRQRGEKLEAEVRELLEGCRTLNQVQKLWPSVVDFISPEEREKLNKKIKRKPREAKEQTITELSDEAKTTLFKARLIGSAHE